MRRLTPFIAVLAIIAFGGCRTVAIQNVTNQPLAPPPNTQVTMEAVSRAIWAAGKKLGWAIEEHRPGELTGTLNLRKHVAVVGITHDTKTFSITYKDSRNLMHEGDQIHNNYNGWVRNLARAIQAEMARVGASP